MTTGLDSIECGQVEIEVKPSVFRVCTVLMQPNPDFPMVDRLTVTCEDGIHFDGAPEHAPEDCAEALAKAKEAVKGMHDPELSGLIEA